MSMGIGIKFNYSQPSFCGKPNKNKNSGKMSEEEINRAFNEAYEKKSIFNKYEKLYDDQCKKSKASKKKEPKIDNNKESTVRSWMKKNFMALGVVLCIIMVMPTSKSCKERKEINEIALPTEEVVEKLKQIYGDNSDSWLSEDLREKDTISIADVYKDLYDDAKDIPESVMPELQLQADRIKAIMMKADKENSKN